MCLICNLWENKLLLLCVWNYTFEIAATHSPAVNEWNDVKWLVKTYFEIIKSCRNFAKILKGIRICKYAFVTHIYKRLLRLIQLVWFFFLVLLAKTNSLRPSNTISCHRSKFNWIKCIWTYCLWNGSHFVQASMYYSVVLSFAGIRCFHRGAWEPCFLRDHPLG